VLDAFFLGLKTFPQTIKKTRFSPAWGAAAVSFLLLKLSNKIFVKNVEETTI
jgi:hypothetical protein